MMPIREVALAIATPCLDVVGNIMASTIGVVDCKFTPRETRTCRQPNADLSVSLKEAHTALFVAVVLDALRTAGRRSHDHMLKTIGSMENAVRALHMLQASLLNDADLRSGAGQNYTSFGCCWGSYGEHHWCGNLISQVSQESKLTPSQNLHGCPTF